MLFRIAVAMKLNLKALIQFLFSMCLVLHLSCATVSIDFFSSQNHIVAIRGHATEHSSLYSSRSSNYFICLFYDSNKRADDCQLRDSKIVT
jgi:hypothetical protein